MSEIAANTAALTCPRLQVGTRAFDEGLTAGSGRCWRIAGQMAPEECPGVAVQVDRSVCAQERLARGALLQRQFHAQIGLSGRIGKWRGTLLRAEHARTRRGEELTEQRAARNSGRADIES
jgi:hypothetical protein